MNDKVKQAQKEQIRQYLKDIEEIAEQMEKTDQKEVRGMMVESIQFRTEKIRELLGE